MMFRRYSVKAALLLALVAALTLPVLAPPPAAPVQAQDGARVALIIVDDFSGSGIQELAESAIPRSRVTNERALQALSEAADAPGQEERPGRGRDVARQAANESRADVEAVIRTEIERTDRDVTDLRETNCAVNMPQLALEGQGLATMGMGLATMGMFEEEGRLHGEVVLEQVERLIKEEVNNANIEVFTVDTQGFSTAIIAERIQAKMDEVRDEGFDLVVINMSFSIIPCDLVADVLAYEQLLRTADEGGMVAELQVLLQSFQGFYTNEIETTLMAREAVGCEVAQERGGEARGCDPVEQVSRGRGRGQSEMTVIRVASSGNFALEFPFAPALWPGIISVSAGTGEGFKIEDLESFSNWGEIVMPGEYEGYFGTSFAAPRLSVLLAHFLSVNGGDPCARGGGDSPLAYGGWDNLTISEAAEAYCPPLMEVVDRVAAR